MAESACGLREFSFKHTHGQADRWGADRNAHTKSQTDPCIAQTLIPINKQLWLFGRFRVKQTQLHVFLILIWSLSDVIQSDSVDFYSQKTNTPKIYVQNYLF